MKIKSTFLYPALLFCFICQFAQINAQCTNDTIPPIAICDGVINIQTDQEFTLYASGVDDGSWDNCTDSLSLDYFITRDYQSSVLPTSDTLFYPAGIDIIDTVALWVVDEAGNANSCVAVVIINTGSTNCTNDTEAPIMVCYGPWFITLGPDDDFNITADELDLNSFDNCTSQNNLERFVSSGINDPDQYQTIINYPAGTTGIVYPILTIRDEAGNESTCEVSITITSLDSLCANDSFSPGITCLPDIVNPYTGLDYVVVPQAVYNDAWDNCTPDSLLSFYVGDGNLDGPPPSTQEVIIPEGTIGWTNVGVWVVDEAGNWSQCSRRIMIEPNPAICNNDTVPPVAICEQFLTVSAVLGNEFILTAEMIDDGSLDNCTTNANLDYFVTQDGSLTTPPSTDTIAYPSGSNLLDTVYLWVVDEAGNASSCATQVNISTDYFFYGNVFKDQNGDCLKDSIEASIGNISLQYTSDGGMSYTEVTTGANGIYYFSIPGSPNATEATIELLLPNGLSSSCPTTVTVDLGTLTEPYQHDFAANLATDCQNMTVDISTFRLRRCFPSTYTVSYCNNSAFDIDSVELIVTLPPSQVIQSVGLPYTDIGNNRLLFDLGLVSSGYCEQFPIIVIQDCTTPLGATKCVQAEISPYNCDDPMLSYDGSDLEVTAVCDENDELVRFTITNVGESAMTQSKEYIVIEDVIMYMQDPIQLDTNETHEITFPANGSTWRLEIEQEAGHPSLSTPSVAIEGCLQYGSMGFINQFSQPDADPYIAIDCQEVIGSFDPNDKRAFPEGYAEEHFIEKNTSIEYNIRFQNTGTDTAFTVRLEDQLDENLDWSSISAGASSHSYRMELQQDGKLIFHFENINLPDSTVNEMGSHGFVQFRIDQLPDNELGTVIENTADIYFDFNEAIITNTVFHTIGENFVVSSTIETSTPEIEVSIAPNPCFPNNRCESDLGHWQINYSISLFIRPVAMEGCSI